MLLRAFVLSCLGFSLLLPTLGRAQDFYYQDSDTAVVEQDTLGVDGSTVAPYEEQEAPLPGSYENSDTPEGFEVIQEVLGAPADPTGNDGTLQQIPLMGILTPDGGEIGENVFAPQVGEGEAVEEDLPYRFLGPSPYLTVVLQGLDKITGRISTLEVPLGETVPLGPLAVTAHYCYSPPPEEPPDSIAFLEIIDRKPNQAPQDVFSGWMFASSPALVAMEHAIYDVWVLSCKRPRTASGSTSDGES